MTVGTFVWEELNLHYQKLDIMLGNFKIYILSWWKKSQWNFFGLESVLWLNLWQNYECSNVQCLFWVSLSISVHIYNWLPRQTVFWLGVWCLCEVRLWAQGRSSWWGEMESGSGTLSWTAPGAFPHHLIPPHPAPPRWTSEGGDDNLLSTRRITYWSMARLECGTNAVP